MPGRYNGRRNGGGRRRSYRRTYKRRSSRRPVVRRAQRVHVEYKTAEASQQNTDITDTGTFFLLNPMTQGVSGAERIGNTAYMKSLDMYIEIRRDGGAPPGNIDVIQMALLWDKDPDGGTPATASYIAPSDAFGMRNLTNRERWWIIKTWHTSMTGIESKAVFRWHKYKRFTLKTVFEGTGATIASIRSGALWLFVITDTALVDAPKLTFRCRVRFTDA